MEFSNFHFFPKKISYYTLTEMVFYFSKISFTHTTLKNIKIFFGIGRKKGNRIEKTNKSQYFYLFQKNIISKKYQKQINIYFILSSYLI
jgi:hypothetical protein